MKHLRILPILLLMFAVAGCHELSSKQKVTVANESLAGTMKSLRIARDAGLIKDTDLIEAKPYIDAAVAASLAATKAAEAGDESSVDLFFAAYNAALDKLLAWRAETLGIK